MTVRAKMENKQLVKSMYEKYVKIDTAKRLQGQTRSNGCHEQDQRFDPWIHRKLQMQRLSRTLSQRKRWLKIKNYVAVS